MANPIKFINRASLAVILLSINTTVLAAIYKCNNKGITSYQSAPCNPSNTADGHMTKLNSSTKTRAVKHCENTFNNCLSELNPSLYKEGKELCTARLDFCIAKSERKNSGVLKQHLKKVDALVKRYSAESANIKSQNVSKERQIKRNTINANYNLEVRQKAEKYYKQCFEKLSSSITNISEASQSLKRACSNNMPASCQFGLRKAAQKQCTAERDNYLNKWLK